MKNFSIVKKGYDTQEVDDYLISLDLENSNYIKDKQARIDELRLENFELNKKLNEYKVKEDNISKALTIATMKAEEIQNLSKQKYETEIKNLNAFYLKWEKFFNELINRYPKMLDFNTNNVLEDIKKDINLLLKNEFLIENENSENEIKLEATKILQNLKPKKRSYKKATLKLNKSVNLDNLTESENNLEFVAEHNKMNNIKPITNLTLNEEDKEEFGSLVDKFLHTSNKISQGYEKSILNKSNKKKKTKIDIPINNSGFDFNEALNPTEDLTNIMKGFKLD